MFRVLAVGVLFLALVWSITSCGGSNCNSACSRIAQCASQAGVSAPPCNLDSTCGPKQQCLANCIIGAPCTALLGQGGTGFEAYDSCQQQCGAITEDTRPESDAGTTKKAPGKVLDAGKCEPDCTGKQCGDDGCGGSCGGCLGGSACNSEGKCVQFKGSSGELCDKSCDCPVPNEQCLKTSQAIGAKGMCLLPCFDPGAACDVLDPKTQAQACVLALPSGQYFCAFLCKDQSKTYSCPTNGDFKCIFANQKYPDKEVCMPK